MFAVHPIHTEVVANLKSRDELLAFLFLMGADGRYLAHFSSNATAEEIAEGVKKYL